MTMKKKVLLIESWTSLGELDLRFKVQQAITFRPSAEISTFLDMCRLLILNNPNKNYEELES